MVLVLYCSSWWLLNAYVLCTIAWVQLQAAFVDKDLFEHLKRLKSPTQHYPGIGSPSGSVLIFHADKNPRGNVVETQDFPQKNGGVAQKRFVLRLQ